MRATPKQRAYHDRREWETAEKLNAALERMRTGRTLHLPTGFTWSKKAWADEAGVNKDTVVAKNADGVFKFAQANAFFEKCRRGTLRLPNLQRLKNENAELQEENLRLKKVLAGMGDFQSTIWKRC